MSNKKNISHFPNKDLKIKDKQKLAKIIDFFFSYDVFILGSNDESAEKIFVKRKCPNCEGLLYRVDMFNESNLGVTFCRPCHSCNVFYIISGFYGSKEEFLEAFEHWKGIYAKRREKIEKKRSKEIIENFKKEKEEEKTKKEKREVIERYKQYNKNRRS